MGNCSAKKNSKEKLQVQSKSRKSQVKIKQNEQEALKIIQQNQLLGVQDLLQISSERLIRLKEESRYYGIKKTNQKQMKKVQSFNQTKNFNNKNDKWPNFQSEVFDRKTSLETNYNSYNALVFSANKCNNLKSSNIIETSQKLNQQLNKNNMEQNSQLKNQIKFKQEKKRYNENLKSLQNYQLDQNIQGNSKQHQKNLLSDHSIFSKSKMQMDSYSTFDNNINMNNLQSQLINKKLQKETSIVSNQEKNSQQNDKFQQQTKSLNVFQMSENSGNSKTFTQNVIVSNCNLQNTLQNCNQNSSNFHAFNSNKYSIQQDIRFSHDQLLMNKSINNLNNVCNNSNNQRQQDIYSFRNLYQNQNNLGLNTKNEIITEKEESDRNICEEEDIIKNEQYNFNNDTNNKNKITLNKKYTDQNQCNDLNINDNKFGTLQYIQKNANDQNNIKSEKYLKLQKQAEYIRYQMQKQQLTHAKEQFDELTKYQLKEQFFKERKNYLISQGFYEFDPDAIPVPKLQKVKNSSILTRRIFVFYKNEIMQNPKIFVQNKFQKF